MTKDDGVIDWSWPAARLHDLIRGLHPWPHAFTFQLGHRLIVMRSTALDTSAADSPGTILEAKGDRLVVATGAGALQVVEIQAEGKRPMSVRDFLAGHPQTPGDRLTSTP